MFLKNNHRQCLSVLYYYNKLVTHIGIKLSTNAYYMTP